jgi:hypothetical protein
LDAEEKNVYKLVVMAAACSGVFIDLSEIDEAYIDFYNKCVQRVANNRKINIKKYLNINKSDDNPEQKCIVAMQAEVAENMSSNANSKIKLD